MIVSSNLTVEISAHDGKDQWSKKSILNGQNVRYIRDSYMYL